MLKYNYTKDYDEVDWKEHQLSAWLKIKDPNWTWKPVGTSNQFFDRAGNLLAIVIYHPGCKYRVFIPKILNAKGASK